MKRLLPVTAALAVLACCLVVHAMWTGRWDDAPELAQAVARLDRVPAAAGDWQAGRKIDIRFKDRDLAGIKGYVNRVYTNRKTGAQVTLLIICGQPGPISVHTPDVCYRGAGFRPGPLSQTEVGGGAFWTADFRKDAVETERLRIYWAWNAKGVWEAPGHARLHFAGNPALYKMYVVRGLGPDEAAAEGDASVDFLKQMLPGLEKALAPAREPAARRGG